LNSIGVRLTACAAIVAFSYYLLWNCVTVTT